jgi:hypothetical protein
MRKDPMKNVKVTPALCRSLTAVLLLIASLQSSFAAGYNTNFLFNSASEKVDEGTRILESITPFSYDLSLDNELSYMRNMNVFDSLKLQDAGLTFEAFEFGVRGMEKLIESGANIRPDIISIADFSQASSEKRLYVIDLENYRLLYHTWVAHGRNSGKDMAYVFSNKFSSYKSSPGFYITGDTYRGSNGFSLKLDGVEKGINDNAARRAIVIHGANYVSEKFIDRCGYLGRSEGCPAVDSRISTNLINDIKDGTCLFIYSPTRAYIRASSLLN